MEHEERLRERPIQVESPRPGNWLSGALARTQIARILPDVLARVTGRSAQPGLRPMPRLARRPSALLLSFIILVAVPSLLAQVYLAFIASDQFVAETRFAVRTAQAEGGDSIKSALSSLSSGSIPSGTGHEAYVVTSYIHSRAIIDDLAKVLDVRQIFRRPNADFWARLKANAPAEELLDYWDGMVSTYVDGPSGIVTVKVRAFRPDDALAIARAIITLSEKLANDVSARARADTMRRAEMEVRRSEGKVRVALQDMREYRETEGYLNPVNAATSTSKLLLELMGEKIRIENDLFVATRAMSAEAPSVRTMKAQLDGVDKQIDQLKATLTGNSPEGRTISASLVKFEALELKRIFAEKLYTMAQDSLERAREKAERQNIYVSVFVPPALPEEALYPERLSLSIIIPLALLIIWGIFALTVATVEDHRR